jgi:hypothetical protein
MVYRFFLPRDCGGHFLDFLGTALPENAQARIPKEVTVAVNRPTRHELACAETCARLPQRQFEGAVAMRENVFSSESRRKNKDARPLRRGVPVSATLPQKDETFPLSDPG